MNCGACAKWRLDKSPLRAHGYGLCADELPVFRNARTYSGQAPCIRPGSHAPASERQIELRQRAKGAA